MTTYPAPHPEFIAARWSGGRQDKIKWIVMHSAVCACREGAARGVALYFARTDRPASAHYSVDPGHIVQSVADHTVAYHCGYNEGSIAVEMCEMPDQANIERWDDAEHRRMERRAAKLVAKLCLAYNIRPYYVSRVGLLLGIKGITTHRQMSLAFKKSTHWDPGAWRRRRFMREVRRQVSLLKAGWE
jgi:N-acetylmuramoyl-L-alanine amidase CwlA